MAIFLPLMITAGLLSSTRRYRKTKIAKASSWVFMMLVGLGCGMTHTSLILSLLPERPCSAVLWLGHVGGFAVVFSALFSKNYRVMLVFNFILDLWVRNLTTTFDPAIQALRRSYVRDD